MGEMGLTKVWNFVAKMECSSSKLEALPPQVCSLVGNAGIEKQAVDFVCSKQSEVPAAECEMALTKVWDFVAKMECSSGKLGALPPQVCSIVGNAAIEKKALDFVCSKQTEVPAAECEMGLTKVWNFVAKMECSSGKLEALPPQVCSIVGNAAIEKKALDFVC